MTSFRFCRLQGVRHFRRTIFTRPLYACTTPFQLHLDLFKISLIFGLIILLPRKIISVIVYPYEKSAISRLFSLISTARLLIG